MVNVPNFFLLHFFAFKDILSHFSKKKFFLKILLSGTDHITLWLLGQCIHTKGMIKWSKGVGKGTGVSIKGASKYPI